MRHLLYVALAALALLLSQVACSDGDRTVKVPEYRADRSPHYVCADGSLPATDATRGDFYCE